ncbi:MAG: type II toxin-antitoxin system VapC family toxin [Candidatus Baltobacteraceae bacterium]
MAFVLDVSATMSWLLGDERDELAIGISEAVLEKGATVPPLWRWEIRNALLVAHRRGRISNAQISELLEDLTGMPIRIDLASLETTDEAELAFAERYQLSVYDAAYLELAWRMRRHLMTRDKQLIPAARDLNLFWEL